MVWQISWKVLWMKRRSVQFSTKGQLIAKRESEKLYHNKVFKFGVTLDHFKILYMGR